MTLKGWTTDGCGLNASTTYSSYKCHFTNSFGCHHISISSARVNGMASHVAQPSSNSYLEFGKSATLLTQSLNGRNDISLGTFAFLSGNRLDTLDELHPADTERMASNGSRPTTLAMSSLLPITPSPPQRSSISTKQIGEQSRRLSGLGQ
jgi:hypothetical protein